MAQPPSVFDENEVPGLRKTKPSGYYEFCVTNRASENRCLVRQQNMHIVKWQLENSRMLRLWNEGKDSFA